MFYFISITINLYFVRSYRKITTRNLETSILRIRNREFKYTDMKVTQFKRKRNFCLRFVCRQKKPKRKKKFYSCCKWNYLCSICIFLWFKSWQKYGVFFEVAFYESKWSNFFPAFGKLSSISQVCTEVKLGVVQAL